MAILETRRQKVVLFMVGIYGLTFYTLWNAYKQSHSFLQWTIKLNQGFSFIILCTFILLNFFMLWQGVLTLLYGELRLIEQEHIFERLPLIIIPIIMISPYFNYEHLFSIMFWGMISIIMQVSTWILKDRLEGLLQGINDSTTVTKLIFSDFIRNVIVFAILHYFTLNYTFIRNGKKYIENKNSINVAVFLFGYNLVITFISYLNITCQAILNIYAFYYTQPSHNHNDGNDDGEEEERDFEGKFIYEKCIDLFTKLLDVTFAILVLIPLRFQAFYLKDLLWNVLLLIKQGMELFQLFKNNKKLDDKLPDVIVDDLIGHDNVCIVCMDDLVELSLEKKHEIQESNDNDDSIMEDNIADKITQDDIDSMGKGKKPKILPCGHMLHFACLKHWMERSQTCPTCRLPVFDSNGNVKPVKHHHPIAIPETTPQPQPTPTVSTAPSDYNTQDLSVHNVPGQSSGTDATNISAVGESSTSSQFTSLVAPITTIGNASHIPKIRTNNWSSFPIIKQNQDRTRITFEVSNGNDRKETVEFIAEPKEAIRSGDQNTVYISDLKFEGRTPL